MDFQENPEEQYKDPASFAQEAQVKPFTKGWEGGPGRPKNAYVKFAARTKELSKKYTMRQVRDMIEDQSVFDLPVWDAIVIRALGKAFTNGGRDLQILLDRVEGRVKQTLVIEEKPPVKFFTLNLNASNPDKLIDITPKESDATPPQIKNKGS